MSQEKDYIWKVNGIELELDLDDADVYDSLMNAFEEMDGKEEELKHRKNSNPIRGYCELFYQFYDRVFGKGTSEKLFKGYNARICDETWESFMRFLKKQGQENSKRRMQLSSKYQPNRQQRRAGNRKGKSNKNYSGPYAL